MTEWLPCFHPANVGLSATETHVNLWWAQEGFLAKVVTDKSHFNNNSLF